MSEQRDDDADRPGAGAGSDDAGAPGEGADAATGGAGGAAAGAGAAEKKKRTASKKRGGAKKRATGSAAKSADVGGSGGGARKKARRRGREAAPGATADAAQAPTASAAPPDAGGPDAGGPDAGAVSAAVARGRRASGAGGGGGGGAKRRAVLVTGAAGTLARHVIRRLKHDYDVVAVDFRHAARLGPRVPSYKLDVTKRGFEDVFRKHDIGGIIHIGRIGAEESSRESRYNANVLGSRRMFDLALQYGVRKVVLMSTFYVYGASPYNPALLDESSPLKASNLTMDLVDSVELENLANIYLWRYPELAMTILRPCHIAGPGVRNTMSMLLSQPMAPYLVGFSPMMQFIHVDDMARAIELAYREHHPGIYNVAPADWLPYQDVLRECGCLGVPLPSVPGNIPAALAKLMKLRAFPSFLVDYFKYPVIIDGALFRRTFGFEVQLGMEEIFAYYRYKKVR